MAPGATSPPPPASPLPAPLRRRASGRGLPAPGRRSLLALLALSLALLAGGERLGTAVGAMLVVSDPPAPADATLLTYSSISFARPQARRAALDAAATRYHQGHAPHILLSGFRSDDGAFRSRTARAREYLTDAGVPAGAVDTLPEVGHEYEEALVVRAAVAGRGWQRLVAYAPDFRSRRTAGTLRRVLAPTGIEVRLIALADPEVPLDRWWHSAAGVAAVANEYPRLAYYFLRRRLN